jgi:hypothetical protein
MCCKCTLDSCDGAIFALLGRWKLQSHQRVLCAAQKHNNITCRHSREWMRCLSRIQRSLLLGEAPDIAQPTFSPTRSSQVVIFVVTDTNAPAAVLSSLHLCAQLLAPCTRAGQSELRRNVSETSASTQSQSSHEAAHHSPEASGSVQPADAANAAKCQHSVGGKATMPSYTKSLHMSGKETVNDVHSGRYSTAGGPGHKAHIHCAPQPWRTLLEGQALATRGVVLQAITPAMLEDVAVCAPKATAFAVHSKLCACAQGTAATQQPNSPCPSAARQGHAPAVTVQSVAPAFKLSQTPLPQLRLEGLASIRRSHDGAKHASSSGKKDARVDQGSKGREAGGKNHAAGGQLLDIGRWPWQRLPSDNSQRPAASNSERRQWPQNAACAAEGTERSLTGWRVGKCEGDDEMEEGESVHDDWGYGQPYSEEASSASYWHNGDMGCAAHCYRCLLPLEPTVGSTLVRRSQVSYICSKVLVTLATTSSLDVMPGCKRFGFHV